MADDSLDRLLAPYFATLGTKIDALKKGLHVEPRITVTSPDVHVPEIKLPDITVPDITIPEITIPEIKLPEIKVPDVTVNVDHVKVENWPEQHHYDDAEIRSLLEESLKSLKILEQKTGGASGPTEYKGGDAYAHGPFGIAAMWEDTGNTMRTISAANPLPVDVGSLSVTVDSVELKDGTTDARATVSATAGVLVAGKDVSSALQSIPVNDSKHAVGKAVDVQGGFYYTGVWAAGDGTMTPIRTDEEGRTILSADSETISVSALEAGIKGSSVNGTRALLSANTWYSVPSTVPLNPYILVASFENAVGTIRMGFANSGTPSVTNGNQAPQQVVITLGASEVLYFGSTTAGDDINWTTKELV